jgi:hypothetical protein
VDASGTVTGERRYLAFDGTRAISGTVPTRYGFTGQREESDIELYFCSALVRRGPAALRAGGYLGAGGAEMGSIRKRPGKGALSCPCL